MLNILFIISSPVVGGGERYLLSLSQGLVERGHRVIVLCSANLAAEFAAHGAIVFPLHLGPKLSKRNCWQIPFIPLLVPYFIREISRLRKKYPIDILHVQYKKEQVLAALATWFLPITTVWTEHGPLHDLICGNPLLIWAYRAASLTAAKIITVSEATKSSLQANGIPGPKLVRIYNGIQCDTLKKEQNPTNPEHILAVVAGLVQGKGHSYLLEAVRLLRDEGLKVRLQVVGDGPLRGMLEQYVRTNDLMEQVTFWGQISHEQVQEVIEGAGLVVMPSDGQGEGLPYAVLEAMERGKPVVACAAGGLPEVVLPGETGLLVPPRDPASLAAAIKQLWREPRRAKDLGLQGRRLVEAKFSRQAMIQQTEAVFLDLAAARKF